MLLVTANEDEFDGAHVPVDIVRSAGELALKSEAPGTGWTVTVLLTTEDDMRKLNQRFNNENHATDVLSFNHAEGWINGARTETTQRWPGEEEGYLGDVAICVEQARKQALQQGRTVEYELALLTIHGTLHLLGYDHADKEEESIMFAKTDAILQKLFSGNGSAK